MKRLAWTILSLIFVVGCTPSRPEQWPVAAPPGDESVSLEEIRSRAEAGDRWAQFQLGLRYGVGEGVEQDDKEAMAWYRRAADQGDAHAQHNLGAMYLFGRGGRQDYVAAYLWLDRAGRSFPPGPDRTNALDLRDGTANFMTPAELAEAQRRARAEQLAGE